MNHSSDHSNSPERQEQPDSSTEGSFSEVEELRGELTRLSEQLLRSNSRIAELEHLLANGQTSGPAPEDAFGGDGQSALRDQDSQLFTEAYFDVALETRLAAAKRHLRPVAVVLAEFSEGPGTSRSKAPAQRCSDAIRQTLRDADTACRLNDGTFALILEDTPENGAVWTIERIRRNLVSRFGTHTMWAGVACYPAHAFSTGELVEQARSALVAARDWNQDRIEVAISE